MISVSEVGMQYGDRTLFADVSFQLNPGERYGLVGANGSGKTTLLNILAGDLPPTEGTVSIPGSASLGVLRQEQFLYEDREILGVALMGDPVLWDAMQAKEAMLAGPEEAFDAHRFSELEETVQRHDGYAAEARAARILEGLGIPGEVHHDRLSTLSGGFRLRVLLAQVLAGAPDVLLLDEPTNHLDILSIRWLETFLQDFAGPAVVISHDHRFLDNVATRILDVDYETVLLYHGNYTDFQEAKRAERERREKEIAQREKEIAHHRQFVDRFRAKATKARQAQSKLRLIEKKAEELMELPGSSRRYPTFRFEQRRASGKQVLTLEGVRKAFDGNEVLHGVDLRVRRGDRLAIIGPNGIGKSTLLEIVMGELEPDAGQVTWGHETHPGYFVQDHHERLATSDQSAEEWIRDFCPGRDRRFVRAHMGLMLFDDDDAAKPLATLSGGEATRLVFGSLILRQPNVLVLDEPTNHLDLESIEALVDGLRAYDGTLVFVSHDRWFVGELATRVVEIAPTGITDFPGSYDEYIHACGDDHLDVDRVVAAQREKRREKTARRKGRRDDDGPARPATTDAETRRQRLRDRAEELMARIQAAEARLAEIDRTFSRPGYYQRAAPDQVAKLDEERARKEAEVARLMEEWERVEQALADPL